LLTAPECEGEDNWKGKVRKLVNSDEDSLIGKAKAVHASKTKLGTHSLPPIGRRMFSHLQESRDPSRIAVASEDKRHHSKSPPSFFFPTALYAFHTAWNISLVSWG